MPTVDVIVPAYNAAQFLPAALDSVIAQTFADWRILLIDDGSQDDTPEIGRLYADRLGDRFCYLRQANAGLPAARNTAIRHATADLMALLDADDVWLPRRLELSVAAFAGRPHVGLAYGFVSRIDAGGRVLDTFARRPRHAEGRIAPYIYMRAMDLPCPTITFRREAAQRAGMFDETMRASEDRDLWIRIALLYEVALVPEVIAFYRVSPQTMSTDPNRMFQAQMRVLDKHYGAPGCGWRARKVGLGWSYRQRAEALAQRGQPWAALRSALKALAACPFDLHNLRTAASLAVRTPWLRPSVA